MVRCLADVIQSHSGVKIFIEQEVPALTRVVNGQTEHARMDLVFNLNGSVTYLDVSSVAPFSYSPSLVSAASTKTRTCGQESGEEQIRQVPTHQPRSFHPRDHKSAWSTRQEIHLPPRARR